MGLLGQLKSDRLVTALLLLALTIPLHLSGALSRLDNLVYDLAQKHSDRAPPQDVVIVAIDEDSLSQLGRWPWSRKLHAQLIDRLHQGGAKAIGLDILLSEPQQGDPQADLQLARAMQQAGNVVLPVVIEQVRRNGQLIESQPIPVLSTQASAIGRVHAELDADSIARSITRWEGIGQSVWPHFAQALLMAADQWPPELPRTAPSHTTALATNTLHQHEQNYINFSSAKQHFASLSYVQVLQGHFLPDTFRGKLVLVGSTAAGLADSIATPISGLREPTPGVEFLANAVVSMREQTLIPPSPLWLTLLLSCGLAVLPLAWLPRLSAQAGLFMTLGYGLTVLLIGMALPLVLHQWLPLSAALTGIFSAYPLWALRKLQSTTRFMDQELARLGLELKKWAAKDETNADSDPIQNRILHIQNATDRLMALEQQQRETLANISHDIRSPIASAAAQVKNELGAQHPVHRQLTKVLHWTEAFLHTSRAQMLDPDSFETLDIVDLLHQAMDEFYPLAQERQQQMNAQLPLDPVWVLGHFDSLSRAIGNLLGNANKFAPIHSRIDIHAHTTGQHIHIAITDQGPGIPAEQIGHIFQRFNQGEAQKIHPHGGVGLGLYYVQTVAHKHGASVSVSSQPGATTFTLRLPIQSVASPID
ncbi:MAG: CHASE2 domain-containing protein [Pseudomonadota bacterium]